MARTSRTFRTRLPETVDQQLMAFCTTQNMPTSAAIRWAVRFLLAHQGEAMEQLADVPMADPRTEGQRVNGERYLESLERIDLEALMAQRHDPGA